MSLMEQKMGLSENKSLEFKQGLQQAWESVADKNGNNNLSCEEIREVLSVFGWADQIGEEALPLLVKHLDTDNDGRISFDEFMGGMKGWLSSDEREQTIDEGDGTGEEDGDILREDSIESDSDDKNQFAQFKQVFTRFDKDDDGKLESDELEELVDFLRAGKFLDAHADKEDTSEAKQELITVLASQLQQMASHSDDGSISYEDFLNALRNLSIALRDFPLNLPDSSEKAVVDKPEEPPVTEKVEEDELVRLRFDNAALIARQEQLERTMQQIETLNGKLAKEVKERNDELESALKRIKTLQLHKDKSKELSDQLEAQKEELTRLNKAESELTKTNSRLKAELEELRAKHETELSKQRSATEELEDAITIQKEEIDELRRSLQDKEVMIVNLQEQNDNLSSDLEKITKTSRDLTESKNELEVQLSQNQLELSSAKSEVGDLRERVKKLETELKKTAGAAARPPSLQSELEALQSTQQVREAEERQAREALERERAEVEKKLAIREKELLDQLRDAEREREAQKARETQIRREKEEASEKLHESEALRTRESYELRQQLEEKDAAMRRLNEEVRRLEQDRIDREMKWTLYQQETEVKLKELEQGQGHDNIELKALQDKIGLLQRERKKLRLRAQELEMELKQVLEEQREAEDRRSRARARREVPVQQEDQIGSFLSSLLVCCLPASRPVYTDDGELGSTVLSVPEATTEGAHEMRTLRASKRRAPSLISPTQPLIRSDEEDDEEDELEAVRGAGVGLKPSRRRLSPGRSVNEDSSSESSSPSEVVTSDSSEAEKETEGGRELP